MGIVFVLVLSMMLLQEIEGVIDGDVVVQAVPQDAIPAIDLPTFVTASAASFMRDDEMVIGINDGNDVKAYSTWLLDSHEIVNDTIGTTPISVTW